MKSGRDLRTLAQELEDIKKGSHDYIAPAPMLLMSPDKQLVLRNGTGETGHNYNVRPYAHGQIAGLLGIPKQYYDKMAAEAPALLAQNVNAWFARRATDKQMIRTVGDDVRAVVSDRFRALDNVDLAEAALPELVNRGAVVQSVELTETKFYLKATLPTMRRVLGGGDQNLPIGAKIATYDEIPNYEARKAENMRRGFHVGDVVEAMLCLSNSEVGHGSLRIEWGTMVLACLNALIVPGDSFKRYHIGRSQAGQDDDAIRALISNEARQADDRAFWLKVRDMVRLAFDAQRFDRLVAKLEGAQTDKITGTLTMVVEKAAARFSFSESVGSSVLNHLIAGGDLSRYGLTQAVTRASAEVDDYDTATELERVGGQIIELPPTEWKELAA